MVTYREINDVVTLCLEEREYIILPPERGYEVYFNGEKINDVTGLIRRELSDIR